MTYGVWQGAPATFFVVGRIAEKYRSELREILLHDLFDIQSHNQAACGRR